MIIHNANESLSFSIEGYEYPAKKSVDEHFDYDCNWLNVKVIYTNLQEREEYIDPCLLTTELEECIEELSNVAAGNECLYISEFLEPYLKIVAARVGGAFFLGLEYIYDTTDGIWKRHKAAEVVSGESLREVIEELKAMFSSFPQR